MRLFGYYAFHSFINQIRKMLKTWVLIFIVVCMAIGMLIGFLASSVDDAVNEQSTSSVYEYETEETEETDDSAVNEEESAYQDAQEEAWSILSVFEENGIPVTPIGALELLAGIVILLIFGYDIFSADKNASRIFLPADVNILFASPMKPQSVLMFRVAMQMVIAVFLTIYFFIEIPAMMDMFGLSVPACILLIVSWGLAFLFAKLLQVWLYLVYADHPATRRIINYVLYALIFVVLAAFYLYWKLSAQTLGEAITGFFNSPLSRLIPVWGQLKALSAFAANGEYGLLAAACLALAVFLGLLVYAVSRMRGDYYEDAMTKSAELAERLAKARESKGIVVSTKKKDFDDKLIRNEFHKGFGANVFFHKAMYNRRRFATLGFVTKTMITYLVAGTATALSCRFIAETDYFPPVALVLGAFVFFRSLGNPLAEDTAMDYFRTIPESAHAKMFYSLMGGTVNSLLDLIPGMVIGGLILRADPVQVVMWTLLVVTVDFYSTNVGVFINLSVPMQAGQIVKQMVQVMFIYFGLLPDIVLIVIGFITGLLPLFLGLCAVVNICIGLIFFAISPVFIS